MPYDAQPDRLCPISLSQAHRPDDINSVPVGVSFER